ncbi:MAG TPA: hypothetical protein VFY65_02315 [Longimicrobium sp.]|nr:hypothetical protein [Longimicrobium sp.]
MKLINEGFNLVVPKKSVRLPKNRVFPFEYVTPVKITPFMGNTVLEQAHIHAQWRLEDLFKLFFYMDKMNRLKLFANISKHSPVKVVSAVYQGQKGSKKSGTQAAHRIARTVLVDSRPLDTFVPLHAPLVADAVRGLLGATDEVFTVINEVDSLLERMGGISVLALGGEKILQFPMTETGKVDFNALLREYKLAMQMMDMVHENSITHVETQHKTATREKKDKLEQKREILQISRIQHRDYFPELATLSMVRVVEEMFESELHLVKSSEKPKIEVLD